MNQTTNQLVVRYLDDLHRLLQGIDPVERAEVIDGVREHLDAALTDTTSDDDVRAALTELGSPESVAEEAYAGRPRAAAYPVPAPARPPATSRSWLPVIVAVAQGISILVVLMVAGMSPGVSSSSSEVNGVVTQTSESFSWSPFALLAAIFASLPFWLVVVVLVAITALWQTREKVALVAVVPVAAVLLGVLPELGYLVIGVDGVYAGAWTALALTVLGGGAVTVVLVRRALWRAARAV